MAMTFLRVWSLSPLVISKLIFTWETQYSVATALHYGQNMEQPVISAPKENKDTHPQKTHLKRNL